jgi:hypothetical protein
MKFLLLVFSVGALTTAAASARTWSIDPYGTGDAPTIQAGIDSAAAGDTVLVQPGTYTENINFTGKNIVVGSMFITTGERAYIVSTVIDGGWSGSVVTFERSERNHAVIAGFTIQHGSADYGGGVNCDLYTRPTVISNIITDNEAVDGGGLCCRSALPIVVGNVFTRNRASERGGGIHCYGSRPTLCGNTLTLNSARKGGGICCAFYSHPAIKNTICWANTADDGPEICTVGPSSPEVTYCDVWGGWRGEGNIDADPLFTGADHPDHNLCSGSPCIDAGDPSMQDPDGSRADIGVFYPEHPGCEFGGVWHVSTTGDDAVGDGSRGSPFRTIQHAIDAARTPDTVLVQTGTYNESIQIVHKSLRLRSCPSDWGTAPDPEHTIINGQSASSVVVLVNCGSTTALDGFTITNGRSENGGGILCEYTNATISNTIIYGNEATHQGGGICCKSSDLTVIGSTLNLNSAVEGGGIYCDVSSSPTIKNTICWLNNADHGPEICAATGSSPAVTYCNINGGWDGEGNTDRNPLYIGGPGKHNVCSESPCIDAGDPSMLDPDGSRADIGVFFPDHPECFAGNVWRVSTEGDDNVGDGSVLKPFRTIQHAIDVSIHGDTVLVETGMYKEHINFNGKCIAVLGVRAHLLGLMVGVRAVLSVLRVVRTVQLSSPGS